MTEKVVPPARVSRPMGETLPFFRAAVGDVGGVGSRAASSGARTFGFTAQKTRAVAYLIAGLLAAVATLMGTLRTTYLHILEVVGVALVSALVAAAYYARRESPRWDRAVNLGWVFLDVALITAAIRFTGGPASPWFPWYLAPISAAAFLEGFGVVALVALTSVVAYAGMVAAGTPGSLTGDVLTLPVLRLLNVLFAAIVFLIGVVDLKKKRAALKDLRDQEARKVRELGRLSAALDQRTHELAEANQRIEEANRMKSRFLAAMSHELRTPLNAIIGFSEVLLNVPTCPEEKRTRFLTNVHTSGQHLLRLINDILDLSKVEAGRMELFVERLAVAEVLKGVAGVMKGVADKKGVRLTVDAPGDLPPLHADAARLKQIVFNLASNAVKFSPEGGEVTCAARCVDSAASPFGEESVAIEVVDRGIGIAPEHLGLIFEEFRQVSDGTARRHEGTGLGLALVKRLVELHGGNVSVESAPGEGSTFRVILPFRFRGVPEPSGPASSGARSERGRRVVVVGEEAPGREGTSEALAVGGYLPVRTRGLAESLELIRTLRPAAIVLDLPEDEARELLWTLRKEAAIAGIPAVVIASGERRAPLGDATRRLAEGAGPADLVAAVDELVGPSGGAPASEVAAGRPSKEA